MTELTGQALARFEELNTAGQAANKAGSFDEGLGCFTEMEQIAVEAGDDLKRMHALNPAARSLWSMGEYQQAQTKLTAAEEIGTELGLVDEAAIARSNIGRVAATSIVKSVPPKQQPQRLRQEAVPAFRCAYQALKGHGHLYYRYANAQHGSVVSALAGDRRLAVSLAIEGVRVAFRRSPEPYDQVQTYEINRLGLAQLAGALLLTPLGARTPIIASLAKRKLVR